MAYGYDLLIFVFSALIGYRLIRKVPSLLHTPLMSGTNALSGLTIVGAVAAAGAAVTLGSSLLAYLAIILAMVNIAGGFAVTDRMLKLFHKKKTGEADPHA
jgi:NAD(P) transhydrogenase subunit alpha